MMTLTKSLKTFAALAIAFSSTIALAQHTRNTSFHEHGTSYHDRGPQLHEHNSVAHH